MLTSCPLYPPPAPQAQPYKAWCCGSVLLYYVVTVELTTRMVYTVLCMVLLLAVRQGWTSTLNHFCCFRCNTNSFYVGLVLKLKACRYRRRQASGPCTPLHGCRLGRNLRMASNLLPMPLAFCCTHFGRRDQPSVVPSMLLNVLLIPNVAGSMYRGRTRGRAFPKRGQRAAIRETRCTQTERARAAPGKRDSSPTISSRASPATCISTAAAQTRSQYALTRRDGYTRGGKRIPAANLTGKATFHERLARPVLVGWGTLWRPNSNCNQSAQPGLSETTSPWAASSANRLALHPALSNHSFVSVRFVVSRRVLMSRTSANQVRKWNMYVGTV